MNKKVTIKRKNPTEMARERYKEAINSLPSYWLHIFLDRNKEYDNREGRQLISRINRGLTTDMIVIEKLEKIAKEYQQKQSA